MNVTFPLFNMPGVVITLDDEDIAHRLLERVLKRWDLKHFTVIQDFLAEMKHQVAQQESICRRLTKMLEERSEDGFSLKDAIINYWSQPDAAEMASLVLVDYRMPHLTGIEVLQTAVLQEWKGGKVMLTAHADDRIAVEAFNGSIIDKFVSKQLIADTPAALDGIIAGVATAGNSAIQRTWAAQVSHPQRITLDACQESVIQFMRHNGWTYHAVLGQPFGILGMTETGEIQWLQLETEDSMTGLLDLIEASKMEEASKDLIRKRKALPLIEFTDHKETDKIDIQPAFELGSEHGLLLGALFKQIHQP